jgi:hypothetical protein
MRCCCCCCCCRPIFCCHCCLPPPLQTITGHVQPPFDRIPLGRPDHNVHTYVVLPDKPTVSEHDGQPEISAADGQHPSRWRLAEVGEPGELWLSGTRHEACHVFTMCSNGAARAVKRWWLEPHLTALSQLGSLHRATMIVTP